MKLRWGVVLLLAAGCANWHRLRPLTANNIEVGQITVYVMDAKYADSGGRVMMNVMLDNRTNQPQQFDTHWIELRGSSGAQFQTETIHPPVVGSVPPLTRMQVSYMFRHIPAGELSQATLMVAGTATMQFSGFD